ncbi:MAG TPA: (Fe-S)-binding protein [Bradyrhizobium sp.]|nr:(Fe-S)-binding protein [Bradyrhizobium sp.]
MSEITFETALAGRVDEMLDACTRCGKCVEACPSVAPAGLAAASPQDVITGIIDILGEGTGPEASQIWASSCIFSGECIKACDEGVNPRFLLAMARAAATKAKTELPERRQRGVQSFRTVANDVAVLSKMQLETEMLERLGQGRSSAADSKEMPDFIFYTGCNVLKTPNIALLALDLMDRLGISYHVMGGPSHCCGVNQFRTGDVEMSGRMAINTAEQLASSKSGQVLSWCPSCYVQYTETTLPAMEKKNGSRPFEMTPFIRFLGSRLDDLRPHLVTPVRLRVALHRHPGVTGVVEAAENILKSVPGIELVDLGQPAVGLQSFSLGALPAYKRQLQLAELEAAREAGLDALVTVYHSDHRELCAHERNWPFRIVNLLEIVGKSAGIERFDRYKQLKLLQDADLIVAECGALVEQHGLDRKVAREVVARAMLGDQPLPLTGTAG